MEQTAYQHGLEQNPKMMLRIRNHNANVTFVENGPRGLDTAEEYIKRHELGDSGADDGDSSACGAFAGILNYLDGGNVENTFY